MDVLIDAPNDSGKSSILNAIAESAEALAVKGATGPIRKGATSGLVELKLANAEGEIEYTVTRTWRNRKDRKTGLTKVVSDLDVVDGEGVRVRDAADLYKSFISRVTIDCGRVLSMRSQDLVDLVLRKAGVEFPTEEIFCITGQRYVLGPGETTGEKLEWLSADETGILYTRRREQHRIVEQKLGALEEQRRVVRELGGRLKPEEGPKSPTELLAQMRALNAKANERRQAQLKVDSAKRIWDASRATSRAELSELETDYKSFIHSRANVVSERERAVAERDRILKQIEELQRLANSKSAEIDALDDRILKAEEGDKFWKADLAEAKSRYEATAETPDEFAKARAFLDSLPDPTLELTTLGKQLETIEADNRFMSRRVAACEEEDRLSDEYQIQLDLHKRYDDELEAVRELRAHLLDNFDLGLDSIEGDDNSTMRIKLTIADKEVKVNGVSFAQSSKAQQILVACGLAMMEDPRLRILRIDDAERLDFESRKLLFRIAHKRGYQVLFAAVNDRRKTRSLRVQMIDGDDYDGQEMLTDEETPQAEMVTV
jgi:hypothetical protein